MASTSRPREGRAVLVQRIARYVLQRRRRRARLESLSPVFDALTRNAALKRLATAFQFTEGPVWRSRQRDLLFSDIPADRIVRLGLDGRDTTFRSPSGKANGLTLDKDDRLIACEQTTRRLTRTAEDGSLTVVADSFHGKKLNSPNDVVVKSDGSIYFTDPAYGITPEQQEQPIQGVYRLRPNGGPLTLVAGDFEKPNGLAFSPDERSLYIDDTSRRQIRVFDVQPDGSLSNGRTFHDLNVSEPGAPDGMKVDSEGRLYCTGPGGVWVLDPEGRHLGTIGTPEKPSNCAWGGDDWQTLYITARTSVYTIRLNARGIAVP
jgi:gluconolactonase